MKEIPDLTTLDLEKIAQNPEESLALINDERYHLPEFQDYLRTHTPFIHLLPTELELQILLMLPFESWRPLYKTSTHWRAVVVTAALPFFNSVEVKDKLETLLGFDFKTISLDLTMKADLLSGRRERQPLITSLLMGPEIQLLNELVKNLSLLKNPLAKLKLLYKSLSFISTVTYSIPSSISLNFFPIPLSLPSIESENRVAHFATEFLNKAPLSWMKEPWLKTIYQFLDAFPEHPLAKELDLSATTVADNIFGSAAKVEKDDEDTVNRPNL